MARKLHRDQPGGLAKLREYRQGRRLDSAYLGHGDSYDNALAESVIGLYKTELVRHKGPSKTLDDLELATFEWVDWYNHRRLHASWGNTPPAEYETTYYNQKGPAALADTI